MTDFNRITEIMSELGFYPLSPNRFRPTDEDLASFEERLGVQLPEPYRSFLLRYGGMGLDQPAVFPIEEESPWGKTGRVEQFYGLSNDPTEGIQMATTQTYAGRIPDDTLPIGEDAGGNLVLLGISAAVSDRVWFWDHEHREVVPESLDELRADVRDNVDPATLDDHQLIGSWEEANADSLEKPPGWNNVYAVAGSFMEFLKLLRPDPDYDLN